MPNFIMLVGIPGCGKSTLTEKLASEGYAIHSSDAIRVEKNMHDPKQSFLIFEIMHKRIKADMEAGKDIVYDATNLSRKNRKNYLDSIKKYTNYKKICYLFVVPVDVCQERNSHREGYAKVPDYVYDRMLRAFEVPMMSEGWDEIVPILYDGEVHLDFGNLDEFSQNNRHHSLTLGEHMKAAAKYLEDKNAPQLLIDLARVHDIGKFYTKKFENYKGEATEEAHYYGHENYGAYIYLIMWLRDQDRSFEEALHIAQLINWHMAPFLRWGKSGKTLEKDKAILSEEFIEEINLFHEADAFAH